MVPNLGNSSTFGKGPTHSYGWGDRVVLSSLFPLQLAVYWFFVHAVLPLSEPGAYKVKEHLVAMQGVVQAPRVIAFASGESVPLSSAQCVNLPVLVPSRSGEQDEPCRARDVNMRMSHDEVKSPGFRSA